ncbi:hypothetical protein HK407_01g01330 [Ordospora pajunii]|uniref:uncharacterized protein n=1 Tax=Ordospora pajunii TaxID=3039483 RepID=UPI00295273FF|nr:uncharacterized protein HK407_01g01330 [Ordospora pajunii]KAH9412240.1 hypothetical protein HK407_01g01330 [Ordospora pajunii]
MYAIRTLKSSSAVVSAARVVHRHMECIAVNRGCAVEIYSQDIRPVDAIYPNGWVLLAIPVTVSGKHGILLVYSKGMYAIVCSGVCMHTGEMPVKARWTRWIECSRVFVFVAEEGCVAVAHINGEELVFASDVNDFGYYRIIGCFWMRSHVGFVLEDISRDVFLARYMPEQSSIRMVLKERVMLKKGIRYAEVIEDGILLFGNGKVHYYEEDRFVAESEFANPTIRCSLATEKGVLLSMNDGEVIRVSLRRERGMQSTAMHASNGIALRTEVLGNVGTWFSSIVPAGDECYYAASSVGASYYLRIGKRLKVLEVFENEGGLEGLTFFEGKFEYTTMSSIGCMMYGVDLCAEPRYELPSAVRRFGVFERSLIVSYMNEGRMYGEHIQDERKFDEILNVYTGMHCYFNTRSSIFSVNGVDVAEVEERGIVLTAYNESVCVAYTEERCIVSICLETMSRVMCVECKYEVSLLYIGKYLFVSTYNDEFVIMDKNSLKVLDVRRHEMLKAACDANGDVIFVGISGMCYRMCCRDEEGGGVGKIVIECLFSFGFVVETLIYVCGCLVGIGCMTVIADLNEFCLYRCAQEGVSYGVFADELYVSRGNEIYKCKLVLDPRLLVSTRHRWVGEEGQGKVMPRFVANHDGQEVCGYVEFSLSIGNDAAINSYVAVGAKKKGALKIADEILMEGKSLSTEYFVVASNMSKDEDMSKIYMLLIKNEKIKVLCEVIGKGAVYGLCIDGGYVVANRGCMLYVYKRRATMLVELCGLDIGFVPYKIVSDAGIIACSCMHRSFEVFVFVKECNSLAREFACAERIQVEAMMFVPEGLFVTTSDGRAMLYGNGYEVVLCFDTECITSMAYGSLSWQQARMMYFLTRNGRIGGICRVNEDEASILLELEQHANTLTICPKQEKPGKLVDIDLINTLSIPEIERFADDRRLNKNTLFAILNKINRMY